MWPEKTPSPHTFLQLWVSIADFLTRPSASMVDLEARRRSRLLLIILLLFTLFGNLILIYQMLRKPEIPHPRIWGMLGIIWLAGSILDIIGNKTAPQKAVKSATQITKTRGAVDDILRSNQE